ncbi:MAG: thioredoxin [Candidatus Omnitrophica bacterium]|nr:thioredoxin [Candidatus Omnitrophota bacterium]MBU0878792.1 thioredoxin [Candidatus Omnitrophota bacterium]MBU1134171.1 thioredoxin [Candidatus Omnitrophota bacterium]MBU1366940.1 thioredoxin [Candidatus Omnitrophota bacterium]MBU1523427.1 thioredoxin [Candidatus Omnitrophota bacterium]
MEKKLTGENFETEVIDSQTPVLVDFWAPWCGPCKMISPYIEELAKEYEGRLKVCKLSVDDAPEIATKYTIMSIPALMIFKEGKVMEKRAGAIGKSELEKFIRPYVA